MKIGDIYTVEFPLTDTHEQKGTRPTIIVIDFPDLPVAQVIPLTSSKKAITFKYIVAIEPDEKNNLNTTSTALLFQLRAIDKRRLKKKIGELKNKDIKRLLNGLREMYGL